MSCVTRPERRRRIDAWEVPETVSLPLDKGLLIDAVVAPLRCANHGTLRYAALGQWVAWVPGVPLRYTPEYPGAEAEAMRSESSV